MDAEIIEITRSEATTVVIILQRCLSLTGVNAFRFKVRNDPPVKECKYTYDNIMDAISEASGVSKETLKSRRRGKQEITDIRSVTSAIIHELWPELSQREIGLFTNRDCHSTVINHLKNVENIPAVHKLYQEIKFKLGI